MLPKVRQRKEIGSFVRALEHIAGGLVDGYRASTRRRIGSATGVDRTRTEPSTFADRSSDIAIGFGA